MGRGRGEPSPSGAVPAENCSFEEAGGRLVTARGDSCKIPSSSSFSSFLGGLLLGFLPGAVAVFRVLAALLCFAPLWRARGVFGVGTSLGSPAPTSAMPSGDPGCLSVPPPPARFSVRRPRAGWTSSSARSSSPLSGAGGGTAAGMQALDRPWRVVAPAPEIAWAPSPNWRTLSTSWT